jgi:glycosyltransferase involved in cell wall biosynthesis
MKSDYASSQPLVSVVTPVYNGAAYIEECVESLLRQTYKNWQYTVIDNCSSDETPEIVAKLAARETRVQHMRFEELVGSTENHNRAFRSIGSESEFCKVVQADDWLYPECLERMLQVARGAETVGMVSAYRLWDRQVDLTGLPYTESVISGREILRQSLLGRLRVTGAPTAVLYRSRFVREREPFYEDGLEHGDTDAAYWLLSRSDFGFVHQVLSFARRQSRARMTWADEMNTYGPENIRFLLRYGQEVLDPDEYRRRLRVLLWKYVSFHVRQLPKPSRFADSRFFAVHEGEIEGILDESRGDPEVRASMVLVRTMLLRGKRRVSPDLPLR